MAFDDLENIDFTGETRVRMQKLFATDPASVCQVAEDLLQNGPEGVAKAAQKTILSSVGAAMDGVVQSVAGELNYGKVLQLKIGDYTLNFTAKVDLANQFLDLMEGGKIVTPEGIDVNKMKQILKNLDPTTFTKGITKNFNRDKITMIMGSIKDAAFDAKQKLTTSLAGFSQNGALNAKKMISLQGLCNAAATGDT
jgi:hypothetical protein